MKTDTKRDVFRHVESELHAYPYREKEIERLRFEIQHPYDEEQEDTMIVKGKNSVRKPGDPTAKTGLKLAGNARLMHLERVKDAIDEVYDRLPEPQREFIQAKYWTKPQTLTAAGICQELGISDRTFSRWRRKVVHEIADILGWK